MRLTERIGLIIRANLGRLRRDQDPTETRLRRADKMEALLEQLEARLNRAAARQVKLAAQMQQAEEMARQWEQRADEALRAGDEAAAREAIRQKLAYSQVAGELGASLTHHNNASRDLQADVAKLESRLARVKKRSPERRASASATPSQSAVEPAAEAMVAPVAAGDEEPAESVEALQKRMSRVWSDKEIEKELEAIKSRLSAGMGQKNG